MGDEGMLTELTIPTFIIETKEQTSNQVFNTLSLQKTQPSSTRLDRFGQHADFHIWSYAAV